MIEILPADQQTLQILCSENDLMKNDNTGAIVATEGQTRIGYCLFDIVDFAIYLKAVSPSDDFLMADGLIRSVLFYATEKGCTDAYYSKGVNENLLEKIGFISNKETKELKILKIFDSCDCCHN